MTPDLIKLIIKVVGASILIMVLTLGFMLYVLLTELNDPNPNAALTALLGSITGAIGGALGTIVAALAGLAVAISFVWRRQTGASDESEG